MKHERMGTMAATLLCALVAREAFSMDVQTVKDKAGKEYFCANAKCEGKSTCVGAGNDKCGSNNACAKTLGYAIGWTDAPDQKSCEENGAGKWLAFKKEYSIKGGNIAPLKKKK